MIPHFLISLLLPIIFFFIFKLITYSSEVKLIVTEKSTPFECGFEPMSNMRSPFSIRFFILVLLFLIFDVEVALLFPILSKSMIMNSLTLQFTFMNFLGILLMGLLLEWNKGALEWQE